MAKDNLNKRKKCPRCGSKMHILAEKCVNCGLLFERIQNLSNVEAKKNIKEKKLDNVLKVYAMPKDVSKKKFWLLFFFLGWFGGHNIYVGNYKKGYYALITGIIAIFAFCLQEIFFFSGWNYFVVQYYLTSPAMLFFVFGVLIWFTDCLNLVIRQFRYPASLTQEEYEKVLTKKLRGK